MKDKLLEDFKANSQRATFLKNKMDKKLTQSILHLSNVVSRELKEKNNNFDKIINLTKNNICYNGYPYLLHQLLYQFVANNRAKAAKKVIKKLLNPENYISRDRVVTLNELVLHEDVLQQYKIVLNNDDTLPVNIASISHNKLFQIKYRIKYAEGMLKKCDRSLYQEINTLIQEIIVCRCTTKNLTFDSGSDFNCYSTTFINGQNDKGSWLFYVESLVHEAAHMHLFAINTEHQLVKNPVTERFSAPLRKDKRSMSGVYHATFVIARILLAFSQILKKSDLTCREENTIINIIKDYRVRFFTSYHLIKKYAVLSGLADKILNDSHQYVSKEVIC